MPILYTTKASATGGRAVDGQPGIRRDLDLVFRPSSQWQRSVRAFYL